MVPENIHTPRDYNGNVNLCMEGIGNSGEVGGYFSGQKMEIPGRKGGLREIPSMVGVLLFSGTTQ